MPIIKSAIKRVKTTEKANAKNSSQLSKMRTAVKKFEKLKLLVLTTLNNFSTKQFLLSTKHNLKV